MDYDFLLDLVEIAAGIYLIFVAVKMHITNAVFETALMSKGLDINKAPDPQGYIRTIFIPSIIAGVLLIASGVASRVFIDALFYSTVNTICMFGSAGVIIMYGYISMSAQQKYLKNDK